MAEVAFLFPGQGSQYAGMGKELAEQFAVARETFQEADDALGFAISKLCFEGPEDQLKLTENLQPALLSVSTAAFRVLAQEGWTPGLVAGHSLGEYSALVAAGALQFTDAVRLVRKRGRYMQDAVPPGVGGMAAIIRLADGKLDEVLAQAAQGEVVSAANLNSPEQVVIAGHAGAVSRAIDLARAAGAKRAIPLPVSAPFHCALMRPAQERMGVDLDQAKFSDLKFPLINNWEAREIRSAGDAKRGLFEQIPNPVRWTDTIRLMSAKGIRRFVEVGAGTVLTGLCRTIDNSLKGAQFGEPDHLEKVRALVS